MGAEIWAILKKNCRCHKICEKKWKKKENIDIRAFSFQSNPRKVEVDKAWEEVFPLSPTMIVKNHRYHELHIFLDIYGSHDKHFSHGTVYYFHVYMHHSASLPTRPMFSMEFIGEMLFDGMIMLSGIICKVPYKYHVVRIFLNFFGSLRKHKRNFHHLIVPRMVFKTMFNFDSNWFTGLRIILYFNHHHFVTTLSFHFRYPHVLLEHVLKNCFSDLWFVCIHCLRQLCILFIPSNYLLLNLWTLVFLGLFVWSW